MDNRNEIDYICKDCDECVFKGEYCDMGAFVNLCYAVKPFDFYDKAHMLKWISANDCRRDDALYKFYERKCPYYVNLFKLRKSILLLKDGE